MTTNTDALTVTTVRKALIAESYEHRKLRHIYFDVLKGEKPLPDVAPVHAYEALADVGCWEYAVAGMLRRVEAVNPELAAELADFAAWVLADGNEAIEDANDDLDEQVRGDVHVTFAPMKPGQGKSQATAEAATPPVCGFELEDGSVAYYGVGGAE